MPPSSANHDAPDNAERIRERPPRRLQEWREAAGLSKYALARRANISRDMVDCTVSGDSIPTLHITARPARGVDVTLTEFAEPMEDQPPRDDTTLS